MQKISQCMHSSNMGGACTQRGPVSKFKEHEVVLNNVPSGTSTQAGFCYAETTSEGDSSLKLVDLFLQTGVGFWVLGFQGFGLRVLTPNGNISISALNHLLLLAVSDLISGDGCGELILHAV